MKSKRSSPNSLKTAPISSVSAKTELSPLSDIVRLVSIDGVGIDNRPSKERGLTVQENTLEDWSRLLQKVGMSKDRAAFALLYDHFAPRVKSLMLRYGISAGMAEEIAQETFVLVWRKAEQFDADKAMASTWIFTIARNKRIDLIRKKNRPEPDVNDPAFEPNPEPLSDELLSNKERAIAVHKAMALLPEHQREVLQRSYFLDETHSEIAQSLKAPLGTVKSRLRLALNKLRALVDAELGEDSQ